MRLRTDPPRPNRRIVIVSVTLAVLAHVGLLTAISRARSSTPARPPDVEGIGAGMEAAGGLPAAKARPVTIRVVDADSEDAPVPRAIVRDVLGDQWATTNDVGAARLLVRPVGQLLVRVERPGYAILGERVSNTGYGDDGHTIHVHRAPVPYAIVDTIFIQRCNYCHGATGHVAGLDFTSYARLVSSTGNSGPVLNPGHAAASPLVRVLRDSIGADGERRPHARATMRLPADEIEWIAQWVREGANGPSLRAAGAGPPR